MARYYYNVKTHTLTDRKTGRSVKTSNLSHGLSSLSKSNNISNSSGSSSHHTSHHTTTTKKIIPNNIDISKTPYKSKEDLIRDLNSKNPAIQKNAENWVKKATQKTTTIQNKYTSSAPTQQIKTSPVKKLTPTASAEIVRKYYSGQQQSSMYNSPQEQLISSAKTKKVIVKPVKKDITPKKIKIIHKTTTDTSQKEKIKPIIHPLTNTKRKIELKVSEVAHKGGVIGGIGATTYYAGKDIINFAYDIPKYFIYYPTKISTKELIIKPITDLYEDIKYGVMQNKEIIKDIKEGKKITKDKLKEIYFNSPAYIRSEKRKETTTEVYNTAKNIASHPDTYILPITYGIGNWIKEEPAESMGALISMTAGPSVITKTISETTRVSRNIIVSTKASEYIEPEKIFNLKSPLSYAETNAEVVESFETTKTINPKIKISTTKDINLLKTSSIKKEELKEIMSYKGIHVSPAETLKTSKEILPPEEARAKVKGKAPKLEDKGLFITAPKQGQTLFFYLEKDTQIPEYTLNPFKVFNIEKPSTFEVYFKDLKNIDKKQLQKFVKPKYKGTTNLKTDMIDWDKVWKWQKELPKSTAHITIRRTAKFTHEPEAILPVENKLELVNTKPLSKFSKYTSYITKEGKRYNIPLYDINVEREMGFSSKIIQDNKKVISFISEKQKGEIERIKIYYEKGYTPEYKPYPLYSINNIKLKTKQQSKTTNEKDIKQKSKDYSYRENYGDYIPIKITTYPKIQKYSPVEIYYPKKIIKPTYTHKPTYKPETTYKPKETYKPKPYKKPEIYITPTYIKPQVYKLPTTYKPPYYPDIIIKKIPEYKIKKRNEQKRKQKDTSIFSFSFKYFKPSRYTPTIEAAFKNIVKVGNKEKASTKTYNPFAIRPVLVKKIKSKKRKKTKTTKSKKKKKKKKNKKR